MKCPECRLGTLHYSDENRMYVCSDCGEFFFGSDLA